jgi:tetratricopeptide (TPR) repeat protein
LLSRSAPSKEAEGLWERNLLADPSHLPSLLAYADYLARIGSTDRAFAMYERVSNLKHDYGGVHRKIAAIRIQQKQPEKALPELRLALNSSPGNAELLEQIGNLEEQLGNHDAALADWRNAERNATDSGMRKRLVKRIGQR